MIYTRSNQVFILCWFTLFFMWGCKNEESHTPCGRPDCKMVSSKHIIDGVLNNTISQTYVTINGKKLGYEMTLKILGEDGSTDVTITVKHQYDTEGKLIDKYEIRQASGYEYTTRTNYEYDSQDRLVKQNLYPDNTTRTGYIVNQYDGNFPKPFRADYYITGSDIVAHDEFEYDANQNLIQKVNYQKDKINSRDTYSNYNDNGEWQEHLYESLYEPNNSVQSIKKRKITRVFEGCNLKTKTVEINDNIAYTEENTIVNGLIVSTKRNWSNGSSPDIDEFTYDCD